MNNGKTRNRKFLYYTLILTLVLTSSLGVVFALDSSGPLVGATNAQAAAPVVAATTTTAPTTTTVPATTASAATTPAPAAPADPMAFTGTEIKLSLDQAVELTLTSSSGIETAKINKLNNLSKTEEYFQTISDNSQADKMAANSNDFRYSGTSRTAKEMARLGAEFATVQSQKNYDAEINSLKRSSVKQYFETLQTKDAVRIAQDSLKAQEAILKNTNAKFKLGVVAKKDVLNAEVAVNQAKVELQNAQNSYSLSLMNFNLYFGYPVMQKVTLTDTLKVTPPTLTTLDEAIKLALANRNEIAGANFNQKYNALKLIETGNNVSKTSSRYYAAQAASMNMDKAAKEAPAQVEIDVRNKFMQLSAAKASMDLGKLNVEKAKESYRLANLSFNAGMVTLADVQTAQVAALQAEQNYSKSILTYKLAVLDYEQSMTVGTTRFSF